MKIARNLTDLVGNTPLLHIESLSRETEAEIIAKIESFNPMSSVKDRIALSMVRDAETRGEIRPGDLLVEPTSGNTGIGLAFVGAALGYRVQLTMPETMSIERRQLIKALGAEVVLTPGAEGMKGSIAAAEEICRTEERAFSPGQFVNPANPEAHRRGTSQEILRDTDAKLDFFVAGVGTGGTVTGNGEVLKEAIPGLKVIAVEPDSSAVLSGNPSGPHKIQGIGAGFIPEVLNREIIDEIVKVDQEAAAAMVHRMARSEGLLVGISSGAALCAAVKIASRQENRGKRIVVLLPDSGERYLSTWIFQEDE